MAGKLFYPRRFGNLSVAKTLTDPADYIHFLKNNGYVFDSTLIALLLRFMPMAQQAVIDGVDPVYYYSNFDYFAQYYAMTVDGGLATGFDPVGLSDAINMRIVVPTQDAQALFDKWPYLTRLYTAISPEDMNLDPVFSQNPDLPDVALDHRATVTVPCSGNSWITTSDGLEAMYANNNTLGSTLPPALRLETLREAGPPVVEVDN